MSTDPSDFDDEPSEAEIQAMRAATAGEAQAVDEMIVQALSARWQKVARVVGVLMNDFERRFDHLPMAYIQARMQELEDRGVVEIAGDVWNMRSSEVRAITEEAQGEA